MDPLKALGMHAGATPLTFEKAQMLRERLTEQEKKLWTFLRERPNGFKFRRQHPFGIYILDFYCHEKRLSMEIDGKHHNSSNQKEHDHLRTQFIIEMGVREIRYSNKDVDLNFEKIRSDILDILSTE